MMQGQELVEDIDRCRLTPGQCALWWLGQHSFVIKMGQAVVYVDLFLSLLEGRRVPPMLRAAQVVNADLILGTHDHLDHIDRQHWPALADASPGAVFVVPDLLREKLAAELKMPIDRFAGVDDGTSFEAAGLRITGVPAAHELLDADPVSGRHPYLGYVIEGNGCCVYHAGDCCMYEGIHQRLRRWPLDIALLPINGRDAKRFAGGCIGNMTYQEAADLAGSVGPRLTIPTHYDMFESNSEDPQLFLDYMRVKYPRLRTCLCDYGQRLIYERE